MNAADFQQAIRGACELATSRRANGKRRNIDSQIQLFLGDLHNSLTKIDPELAAQLNMVGRASEAS